MQKLNNINLIELNEKEYIDLIDSFNKLREKMCFMQNDCDDCDCDGYDGCDSGDCCDCIW